MDNKQTSVVESIKCSKVFQGTGLYKSVNSFDLFSLFSLKCKYSKDVYQ